MPKNVMKMLKPHPTLGRNDFDLSHRTVHTANFGELIPSLVLDTVPGDKIKVRVSDLVRAQPMVTSPFLRAKQHVDVWFVPYNLMWSRFNEFIADKDEPSSSALKDRLFVPQCKFSDIFNALDTWYNSAGHKDIHGTKPFDSIARNLDLLGYPGSYIGDLMTSQEGMTGNIADLTVNLWHMAAYQLIWYREYRQQYYDAGYHNLPASLQSLSTGPSYLFNFDWMQCDSAANANITQINLLLEALMEPRYRLWKKDIYTGVMPSTQFGNVSTVSVPESRVYFDSPLNISTAYVAGDVSKGTYNEVALRQAGASGGSLLKTNPSNFDILALRKSEAVQRWRENALRAGNQIEDNFEAHYGVKPKSHLNVHPQFVASFDAPLNIGDVNAQAQTGQTINGELGNVAGKAIMSFDGNSEFSFETNDFGVLIGMYSILPEAEYNATNLDRMCALLERQDYFTPEYENLGLEAVGRSVISCIATGGYDPVLGYAPRYFGYKQKHDRCVGDLARYKLPSGTQHIGQFAPWCSPKYDVDAYTVNPPLSCLYVNPGIFNINFNVNYLTVPHFMVDFYANVEAIRHMSVSGMPGY